MEWVLKVHNEKYNICKMLSSVPCKNSKLATYETQELEPHRSVHWQSICSELSGCCSF